MKIKLDANDAQRLINCCRLYGKNLIDEKTLWHIVVIGLSLPYFWLRAVGVIRVWTSWTDLRIIKRHVHTSDETASFVNHAPYNYFDTNCWELLSETATRKLRESRFRTIGFVITDENLARVITQKVTLLYRLHSRASHPGRKCCTQREVSS